jgi:plasmid replication initiation protein
MIVPDWFYEGVIDQALVLTIDPAYFALTGGLERWLYRLCASTAASSVGAGASTSSTCT